MDAIESGNATTRLMEDYSLEITAKDIDALQDASTLLRPGTQVSVAFLPGEDFSSRIDAAARIASLGFRPIPHISARRLGSAHELRDFLAALCECAGVDRVVVIAGDLPQPEGPFADAQAVIETGLLTNFGIKTVGIAGHPEGHANIPEIRLWQAVEDKHNALKIRGLRYEFVTQFGFHADPVLNWLQALRDRGFVAPVRIGIAGPAGVGTLLRFAVRCGVGASTKALAAYGTSIGKLLSTAGPEKLIEDLAARLNPSRHGEVKLHFYPFGGLTKTSKWLQDFTSVQSL